MKRFAAFYVKFAPEPVEPADLIGARSFRVSVDPPVLAVVRMEIYEAESYQSPGTPPLGRTGESLMNWHEIPAKRRAASKSEFKRVSALGGTVLPPEAVIPLSRMAGLPGPVAVKVTLNGREIASAVAPAVKAFLCDHEFAGSRVCAKCGWDPGDALK